MNNNSANDFYRSFFAVLAGAFSAIAAGFIIKLLVERFLHFDPLSELSASGNNSNIFIILFVGGWLFISSLAGGIVCSGIAGKNEMSHILIGSLVVLALYFIIGGTELLKEKSLASWAVLLAIPVGYSVGEWLGGRKRQEE